MTEQAAPPDAAEPPAPPEPPQPAAQPDLGARRSRDPGVVRVASTASRIWGAIVLLAGLWFLAEYTLGYSLPTIPWREVWPTALVLLGIVIVTRGMTRRAR